MGYPTLISRKGKTARLPSIERKKKPNLFSSTLAFSFCEIVAVKGVLKKKKLNKSKNIYNTRRHSNNNRTVYTYFFQLLFIYFFLNIFPITLLITQVFNPFVNTFPCYSEYNWQHLHMNLFQLSQFCLNCTKLSFSLTRTFIHRIITHI